MKISKKEEFILSQNRAKQLINDVEKWIPETLEKLSKDEFEDPCSDLREREFEIMSLSSKTISIMININSLCRRSIPSPFHSDHGRETILKRFMEQIGMCISGIMNEQKELLKCKRYDNSAFINQNIRVLKIGVANACCHIIKMLSENSEVRKWITDIGEV